MKYLRFISRSYRLSASNKRYLDKQLDAAKSAFQSGIDGYFEEWGLSEAEKDIALQTITGMTIAEIAKIRQTTSSMIKKQSSMIYKKAGVIVGGIVPQEQTQLSLFDCLDREKRKSINIAVDKINTIMGNNKVKFAVQGNGKNWKLRQEKLSPCYTTRFSDILEVVI